MKISIPHHIRELDLNDPLAVYRKQFYIPKHQGQSTVYLCGNSLGLQPKQTTAYIKAELVHWQQHGVEGHFRGSKPWKDYHLFLKPGLAHLVGASELEVTPMSTLTTALHLLMVSFYRPTPQRYKIVMEARAFSSDQYAVETQVRHHGFDPADAIVEVAPRAGEHTLRPEDINAAIRTHGQSVALVMFGGVNYYTGQFFDLPGIVREARAVGAQVGFDLAHAVGNLPLSLHNWDVDFACWCSYKYLNAGPGGPAGIFIHEKHAHNPDLIRLAGWWGHDAAARFKMEPGFKPMAGADGWQQSNAQIFSFAALLASLDVFSAVGIEALRAKSIALTGLLVGLLEPFAQAGRFTIITPADQNARGCQVSLLTDNTGRALFDYLTESGVVADWREPNVIRVAPVPLYNSFSDVWRFVALIERYYA
jgi:kynureninase